jgi:hypothetical protein
MSDEYGIAKVIAAALGAVTTKVTAHADHPVQTPVPI